MKHPTGPPTVTVDKEEWERLRAKVERLQSAERLACSAAKDFADTIRFIRESVHRAHHDGPMAVCPASTCSEARKALGEAT